MWVFHGWFRHAHGMPVQNAHTPRFNFIVSEILETVSLHEVPRRSAYGIFAPIKRTGFTA